jgi:hypothetical protein
MIIMEKRKPGVLGRWSCNTWPGLENAGMNMIIYLSIGHFALNRRKHGVRHESEPLHVLLEDLVSLDYRFNLAL